MYGEKASQSQPKVIRVGWRNDLYRRMPSSAADEFEPGRLKIQLLICTALGRHPQMLRSFGFDWHGKIAWNSG